MIRQRITTALFLVCFAPSLMAQTHADEQDGAALCAMGKILSESSFLWTLPTAAGKQMSTASSEFDATFYHLALDTDPTRDPVLQGAVTIVGKALAALSILELDLSSNMTVESVLYTDSGDPLVFSHSNSTLSVQLPAPVQGGDVIEVTVHYRGNPVSGGFGTFRWGHLTNGNPYLWTLSEPYGAKEWWPNKDHPSDKADSVRISVRTPSELRAGSNGLLIDEIHHTDGTTTYDWLHRYPISSYLVSLAVGEYTVYEQNYVRPDSLEQEFGPLTLPILHYVYEGTNAFQGTGNTSGWKRVLEVLPIFEDWYGPYPFPEEKYGHAHVTFGGGMEHQTMTSMGGSSLGLIAHELAHMWYGDLITNETWQHLWLHEGFATYSELLFWESAPERFVGTRDAVFQTYYNRALTATGTLVVADTTTTGNLFAHSRVYSKGGMVLHMLRSIVGDNQFREIMRAFSGDASVRYGTAVTADFQHVAESVSGENLASFFRQWVTEGTGYPRYEMDWLSTIDNARYSVLVELRQTQAPELSNTTVFEMPIDIAVLTEEGVEQFTVDNVSQTQSFLIQLNAKPLAVELDPERKILRDPIVETADRTVLPDFGVTVFPNPSRGDVRIRIDLPQQEFASARLFDLSGRLVASYELGWIAAGSTLRTLPISGQTAAGSYTIEIRTETRSVHTQLTLLR